MDADVIITGAGPTGLMLAGELALAGVKPLVLEKRAAGSSIQRGSGIGGVALTMLRYRGLYDRFRAIARRPELATGFPFGSLHLDLTDVPDNPMHGMPVPQAEMIRLLTERATGLGATIRYDSEVTGVRQDPGTVTVTVAGAASLTARYAVGCEGGYSAVRETAGIPFPGTTYPGVNRLASVTRPDAVKRLDNGDFEVAGIGVIPFGFTHTDRGTFAISSMDPAELGVYTEEDDPAAAASDEPMTVDELAASIRRVMGFDLPLGEPRRLTRFSYQARHAERYRDGRVFLAGDAAHLFPAGGQGIGMGMLDGINLAWKLASVVRGQASDALPDRNALPESSTPLDSDTPLDRDAPLGGDAALDRDAPLDSRPLLDSSAPLDGGALLDSYAAERQPANARALLQTRAQVALRRGHDAEATALRDLFSELLQDVPAKRRLAALIAGADVRHPVTGAEPHPLAGTLVPDLALRTDEGATSVAELADLRAARPFLLDLSGGDWVRQAAQGWKDRVSVVTATAPDRPADALLIRPDAYVAWAAPATEPGTGPSVRPDTGAGSEPEAGTETGPGTAAGTEHGPGAGSEPGDGAVAGLREALAHWFGPPLG